LSLFNLQLEGSWGYNGKVTIDTKILEATSQIVLNAKAIKIQTAEITAKDGEETDSRDLRQ
jgi:Ras-related protein Rab-1A